ncbi:MAG: YciI family protein [Candidatus Limnocylindrales bacterium]
MRYLLMIFDREVDAETTSEAEAAAEMAAYNAFTQACVERGLMRGGEALEPSASATTVRVRDGETLVTDGPFAETKEQILGYYLLECADLDEALEMAAKIPGASRGAIEVRPIWEIPAEYSDVPQGAAAAS